MIPVLDTSANVVTKNWYQFCLLQQLPAGKIGIKKNRQKDDLTKGAAK